MELNKFETNELERLEKETVENHEKIKGEILLLVDEMETIKNKINELEIDLSLCEKIYIEIKDILKERLDGI